MLKITIIEKVQFNVIAPALKKHQYWAIAKITGLKKPSPEIDRRGKTLVNFAKAILR